MRPSLSRALLVELDASFPPRGPCAACNGPDARHRLFDELLGRWQAGDSLESLAVEYAVTRASIEIVLRLAMRPSFPDKWAARQSRVGPSRARRGSAA